MSAKPFALVAAGMLALYVSLAAWIGWHLIQAGGALDMLLGAATLALAMLGAWALHAELRFGRASQRLGRELAVTGDLPADDLPRRASGRAVREFADARFEEVRRRVEREPESWQAWFHLASAYDDCGDRRRARSALRRSIRLERSQRVHPDTAESRLPAGKPLPLTRSDSSRRPSRLV